MSRTRGADVTNVCFRKGMSAASVDGAFLADSIPGESKPRGPQTGVQLGSTLAKLLAITRKRL